jgi:hypothetical protein
MDKAKGANRVKVSERALIQRINRKLAANGESLKKSRGDRARSDLGEYYIINLHKNSVVNFGFDLEAKGRELGALAEWEALEA